MTELFRVRQTGAFDWLAGIGVVLLGALAVLDAPTVAAVALSFGVVAVPGWLMVRPLRGLGGQRFLLALPLGVAVTSVLLLLAVPVAGWSVPLVGGALVVACGLALPAHRLLPDLAAPPDAKSREAVDGFPLIVHVLVVAFALALLVPFSRVGAPTPHGFAYTGLFAHDFLLRSSDVVAVSRQIPPVNYYFGGDTVSNYYPLWYVLPAAIFRIARSWIHLHDAVIAVSLLNAAIFCYLLYALIARFLADTGHFSTRAGVLVLAAALFLYSYHWGFVALSELATHLDITWLTALSQQMSDVSASWLKDMLFEPQAILALMLVIALLLILPGRSGVRKGVAIGFLLSVLAVTDIGILFVVGASYFAVRGIRLLRARGRARDVFAESVAAGVVGVALFSAFMAVEIFHFGGPGNALAVRLDPMLLGALPFLLVLEMGPFALTAPRGLRVSNRVGEWSVLAALLVVGVLFMAFVTETLEGNVILRKAMKVVRLPLVLLGGLALLTLPRGWPQRTAAVLLVIALPTWLTDLHAAANVSDPSRTTYVTPELMHALTWLRQNTDADAVVQSAIEYQDGYFEYPPTVFFGERPAAMEYWKAAFLRYPDAEALKTRKGEIDQLFRTPDGGERVRLAHRLGIDFVFVGPVEEQLYPGVVERMGSGHGGFERVYDRDGVQIYRTPASSDAGGEGGSA